MISPHRTHARLWRSPLGVLGAALAAFLLTAPAQAAPPALLHPTGKWNVDYGDAHCIAMRNYGTSQAPLLLAFKPSAMGDVMQVSVIRRGTKNVVNQYAGSMTVDGAKPVPISMLGYRAASGKSRVAAINLPLDLYRSLRGARSVWLVSADELDYRFALTDLDAVARTLDDCVTGLRDLWNIENATGRIKQPAKAKKSAISYFRFTDYPDVALRAGDSGVVALMILIDEAGKVASCQVTATSGAASLDAQSCAVIQERARFDPALGADGKPVRSGTTLRIRWKTGA